ncbi:MAG: hypothetical protein ACJ8ES_00875 [Xanthobacteraceae bacterium]
MTVTDIELSRIARSLERSARALGKAALEGEEDAELARIVNDIATIAGRLARRCAEKSGTDLDRAP